MRLSKVPGLTVLVVICLSDFARADNDEIPDAFQSPEGNDICMDGACIHPKIQVVLKEPGQSRSGQLNFETNKVVSVDTEKSWANCAPGVPFRSTADYYVACEGMTPASDHDVCHFKERKFINEKGELDKKFIKKEFADLTDNTKLITACLKWSGDFGNFYVYDDETAAGNDENTGNNQDSGDDYDYSGAYDDETDNYDVERVKRDISSADSFDVVSYLDLSPESISKLRAKRSPGKGDKKKTKKGSGKKGSKKKSGKGKGGKGKGGKGKGGKGKGGKGGNKKRKGSKNGGKGKKNGKNGGKNKGKGGKKNKNGGKKNIKGGKGNGNKNGGGKVSQKTINKAWCVEKAVQNLLTECLKLLLLK